jgi:hypothetical protein
MPKTQRHLALFPQFIMQGKTKKLIEGFWQNQWPNVFWGSEPSSKVTGNRRKISYKVHGEQFDADSSPQGEITPSRKLSWQQLSHQSCLYWDSRMGTYEGRNRRLSESR